MTKEPSFTEIRTPICTREISLSFQNHSRQSPELMYSTLLIFSTYVCTLCASYYSLKLGFTRFTNVVMIHKQSCNHRICLFFNSSDFCDLIFRTEQKPIALGRAQKWYTGKGRNFGSTRCTGFSAALSIFSKLEWYWTLPPAMHQGT